MKLYIEYYSTNILKCGSGMNTILKETPKTLKCENDVSKEQFVIKKSELEEIHNVYDSLRYMTIVDDKNEGKAKAKFAFLSYFEEYFSRFS